MGTVKQTEQFLAKIKTDQDYCELHVMIVVIIRHLWIAESVDEGREEGGDLDEQDREGGDDRVGGLQVAALVAVAVAVVVHLQSLINVIRYFCGQMLTFLS